MCISIREIWKAFIDGYRRGRREAEVKYWMEEIKKDPRHSALKKLLLPNQK